MLYMPTHPQLPNLQPPTPLNLGNEEVREERHDDDPTRKEKKYTELEGTEHRQECLSDDKRENEVDSNVDGLSRGSDFEWAYFGWDQPTERACHMQNIMTSQVCLHHNAGKVMVI